MQKIILACFGLIMSAILFFCPQKIFAQEAPDPSGLPLSGVVLSEVLANAQGGQEHGLEFVELYNPTGAKVDINGWQITFINPNLAAPKTQTIIDFTGINDVSKDHYYTEIPPGGYALIVDPAYPGQYYNQIALKANWNLITMTVDANSLAFGYLPNKAGTVRISDGTSSTEFTWTKDPGDGISWEYDPPSQTWTSSGSYYGCSPGYDNQDPPQAKIGKLKYYSGKAPYTIYFQSESFDPEGSQLEYEWDFGDGQKSYSANPKHTFFHAGSYEVVLYVWDILGLSDIGHLSDGEGIELTVYPSDIIISEIFPNPPGLDEGQEFVELYNKGMSIINLNGWQIKDSSGGGITLVKEKIKPKSYRIFSGNFYLNNSSPDSVNLYYPGGRLIADRLSYTKAESSFSLALFGKNYQWTFEPTPGKANILKGAPVYASYTKFYSSGYSSTAKVSSYYSPKVKGIYVSATDDSLYPIGNDFRNQNLSQMSFFSLSRRVSLVTMIIALIGLIFVIFYPKIIKQPIRGP